jgi:heme A synthase
VPLYSINPFKHPFRTVYNESVIELPVKSGQNRTEQGHRLCTEKSLSELLLLVQWRIKQSRDKNVPRTVAVAWIVLFWQECLGYQSGWQV